jgi:hypothetical protein
LLVFQETGRENIIALQAAQETFLLVLLLSGTGMIQGTAAGAGAVRAGCRPRPSPHDSFVLALISLTTLCTELVECCR